MIFAKDPSFGDIFQMKRQTLAAQNETVDVVDRSHRAYKEIPVVPYTKPSCDATAETSRSGKLKSALKVSTKQAIGIGHLIFPVSAYANI